VEWDQRPVRIDDLDGQQTGLTAKAFLNVIPFACSSFCTVGMYWSVSDRWSSVTISSTFGCVACATAGAARASAASASVTRRRVTRPLSVAASRRSSCDPTWARRAAASAAREAGWHMLAGGDTQCHATAFLRLAFFTLGAPRSRGRSSAGPYFLPHIVRKLRPRDPSDD
jgi:hypothetical protein